MSKITVDDLRALSVGERLRLVEELWDMIAASPDDLPITDVQRKELDRRIEAMNADPSAGRPWDEVRLDLRRRLQ